MINKNNYMDESQNEELNKIEYNEENIKMLIKKIRNLENLRQAGNFSAAEIRIDLMNILMQLDLEDRKIISYRFVRDLSLIDTAKKLDMTVSQLNHKTSAALQKAADLYAAAGGKLNG